MSNIKLVSKEYTSKFVTGPELNLKLDEKQNKLDWYHESGGPNESGGFDPYKADMASNEVTLRAGGDTVGVIYENAKISLSQEDGQISIESNYGQGTPPQNILSTATNGVVNTIDIGANDSSVYVNGPLYCKGTLYDKNGTEITGGGGGSKWVTDGTDSYKDILYLGKDEYGNKVNSIFVCGPMYDKDGITLIQGKETYPGSRVHQVVIGDGSHSVYIDGPLFDKDGGEITGGSGGSKYISDDTDNNKLILGEGTGGDTANSIFVAGPLFDYNGKEITGDSSTASGRYSTALGDSSTASGEGSTALGDSSTASGSYSTAVGFSSVCSASSSFAIGPYVRNNADLGGVLGNFVRNSDNNTIVIGTLNGNYDDGQFTQLYLIAAGSDLSTRYCGGEAGLGYITTRLGQNHGSSDWQILARGTRKLSDLLTDHTTDFTPDLSLN